MEFDHNSCERGSGLLETMIMSGIVITVIFFSFGTYVKFRNFKKYIKIKSDHAQLKIELNNRVDCLTTLNNIGYSCTDGDYVEISETPTKSLIEIGAIGNLASYSRIHDRYLVRARCDTCSVSETCSNGVKITIEGLFVTKSNISPVITVKHPISKSESWFNIYNNIPFACIL